jgi:hypothetical protein
MTTICPFIIFYTNYNAVTYWKKGSQNTAYSTDTHCKIQMGEANIHGSYSSMIKRTYENRKT